MSARKICLVGIVSVLVGVLGLYVPGASGAVTHTLTDGNSVAEFDLTSAAGLQNWFVDGIDHLQQQWFWYRVGALGQETSIDNLTLSMAKLSDTNEDPGMDTLYVKYLGTNVKLELTFLLTGGSTGSYMSDIAETIRITNTSTGKTSFDFHFFEFLDFDLNNDGSNDTAEITGSNTAKQTAPAVFYAEEVVTPTPNHHAVSNDGSILASLTDTGATTLDDSVGPVTGDTSFAFEWDWNIAAGKSVVISKDKNILPEPATLGLMGLGAAVMVFGRRKK